MKVFQVFKQRFLGLVSNELTRLALDLLHLWLPEIEDFNAIGDGLCPSERPNASTHHRLAKAQTG
ncbi:MAG: hypothetical protein Rhims3KO_01780 [Hyphomicrobiales bacterium]